MDLLLFFLIRVYFQQIFFHFFVELDILFHFFSFPFQGRDIEKLANEPLSLSGSTKDVSDNRPPSSSEATSLLSVSEAQRGMSLYFALCTKVLCYFLEYIQLKL